MDFEISHVTHYKYGHSAAEAYGEARLTPPTLATQEVLSHRLVIDPAVATSAYTDYFGNRVDFFSLPFRHRQLTVRNEMVVRTQPAPRPEGSLELSVQEARQVLGSAMVEVFDYLQPTPVVEIGRDAAQWAKKYLPGGAPLGESLQRMNEAIHGEFKYQSGATENSTPLATVWKSKTGVCQDFAHIALSIVRTAGLPARYVCGYIETDPVRRADGRRRRHARVDRGHGAGPRVGGARSHEPAVGRRAACGGELWPRLPRRHAAPGHIQRERRAGDESARADETPCVARGESEDSSMRVRIAYQTQYAYEEAVTFSTHLFRLFPKPDRSTRVRALDFQTNAGAVVSMRRDIFDNEVASCFYPGKTALLAASLSIELEIAERNAFDFLLASHALTLPFAYTPQEAYVLAPYCSAVPAIEVPFWKAPASPQPTLETLLALNSALHAELAYERRDEGAAYAPEETLRLGRGSCRDFAVLLAEVARGLGLAARLASGYLCEFGDAEKVAEGALHAWTELYLPGAGWVGFDPTNGYLCNHHHLTAAVGLTPADISPVLGDYFADRRVPHSMTASLQVLPQ